MTNKLSPLSAVAILALLLSLFYVGFTITDAYQPNQDPKIETNIQLSEGTENGGKIQLKVVNNTNVDELQVKATGMEFNESIKQSLYKPNKSDTIVLTTYGDGVSPSGRLVVTASNGRNHEVVRARSYDFSD